MASSRQASKYEVEEYHGAMQNVRFGAEIWYCLACDNNNRGDHAMIVTDCQQFLETKGEGKKWRMIESKAIRGVCPHCAEECYKNIRGFDYAFIGCNPDDIMAMFSNPHRPAWLVPSKSWKELGAPTNVSTQSEVAGPLVDAMQSLRARVEAIKQEVNPNYVRTIQTDVPIKTVLLRKEEPVVSDAHDLPLDTKTPQVDENASIYENYNPYDY